MAEEDKKNLAKERALTTDDYVEALESVVRPDSASMRMLQFHYHQDARTTNHEAMAGEMGWKSSAAANRLYGGLGRRVGKYLGWLPKYKVKVLAHFVDPRREHRCSWKMRDRVAGALKALGWVEKDSGNGSRAVETARKTKLFEGAQTRVVASKYERNPTARRACVAHYGAWCIICGFNFKAAYGSAAEGFIHVHHIAMVKEKGGKKYKIDPIRDLRPVCPNCHSVIHIKRDPYTIAEIREMVTKHRPSGWLDPPEVREARLRQPAVRFLPMTPEQA
jgi:predicted HNH restriction endonuclease